MQAFSIGNCVSSWFVFSIGHGVASLFAFFDWNGVHCPLFSIGNDVALVRPTLLSSRLAYAPVSDFVCALVMPCTIAQFWKGSWAVCVNPKLINEFLESNAFRNYTSVVNPARIAWRGPPGSKR